MILQGEPARSSLARRQTALWRANSAWGLPVRHYRVSHLRAETPQDNLEVARGERGRATRLAPGVDVVLIVHAGDRAILAAPGPAVLGVPLPLTGRGVAGPLAHPQPGMGMKQGRAERASLPTGSPRDPGHGITSAEDSATATPRPRGGNAPSPAGRLVGSARGWPIHGGNRKARTHWSWIPMI